jgi:poly(hydroxyalkanoate) depolymerase family esterase
MHRLRRGLAFASALLAVSVAPLAHAGTAASQGSFTFVAASGDGTRGYWLYKPSAQVDAGRPLVVYLHGCNETAEQTAQASHFNDIAAADGFVVVYPQQNVTSGSSAPLADGNGVGCWNWFLDADQHRDAGEPAAIVAITRTVMAAEQTDPSRVFVTGVSAGADMSVILAAGYPDLYAAAAPIAGCAYATCADDTGELAAAEMGSRARIVPMLVENGSADTLNNMAMATGLVQGWLGTDDIADDGVVNDSVARVPATTNSFGFDQTPDPLSPDNDICIHNDTLTCPGGVVGFQGTYPYTVQAYDDGVGREVLEFWVVHGMEHAHPDAPGDGPYTDPLGPDISLASYCFFAAHPMSGAPAKPEGCPVR